MSTFGAGLGPSLGLGVILETRINLNTTKNHTSKNIF
jgi:hypothetical protein